MSEGKRYRVRSFTNLSDESSSEEQRQVYEDESHDMFLQMGLHHLDGNYAFPLSEQGCKVFPKEGN